MPTTIITDVPVYHEYVASPGQVDFDFNFQLFNGSTDLVVTVNDVETVAFGLTTSGVQGGYITLASACAGGEVVRVERVMAYERITQFPVSGPVGMASVNHELNRLVGLIQQLKYRVDVLENTLGYNDEKARDAIGTALIAGDGVTINVNDVGDVITIAATMNANAVQDVIETKLVAGVGIEFTVAGDGSITIASTSGGSGGLTTEDVRDTIGTALVAGAGVNIVVDDVANTITISNTSGAYTDEQARDAIGTALVGGAGINVTVNDGGDTITLSADLTKTLQFPVAASAMTPRTTNGPAVSNVETTTNDLMADGLAYDSGTDEGAQFRLRMPKQWDGGTLTATFQWTTSVASGNVVWGIRAVALADGDDVDSALGTAVTVTDASQGAGKFHQTGSTGAMTVAGLPAAEEFVIFEVYRDADHASDTLAGDAILLGVVLKIGIDKFDDA